MATRIQVRRDLAANWTSNNPTLASGEIGLETDTRKWKIGNGSSNWTSLEYQLPSMTGSWASTPDENVLQIDRSTKRVGINAASLLHDLDVGGTFRATGNSTIGGTLSVTGNTTLSGDLAVNAATNADITTTTSTATVFNTNATTLNIGGAATTIGIGAATGTATINNATTAIAGAATVGGTLAVTGNTTLTGDLAVNGADITTTATGTATVFNTNATTLNVGQAATTVSIGATTGTATIRNATTAITGAATVGGTLGVTGATTLAGLQAGATILSSLGLTTDLAIADGGTGASTAAEARANLELVNPTVTTYTSTTALSLSSFPVGQWTHIRWIGQNNSTQQLTMSVSNGENALVLKYGRTQNNLAGQEMTVYLLGPVLNQAQTGWTGNGFNLYWVTTTADVAGAANTNPVQIAYGSGSLNVFIFRFK